MATADDCPICLRGEPMDVIAELPATWATAASEAPLPGYVCVVSKVHVREPFDLIGDARRAWWDDVSRVAAAVARATSAMKMNYEVHGNTIPHLHLHLYPRYRGDPFDGGPIDPRRRPWFVRSPADLKRLRNAITDGRSGC